jgi:hypothetical protein
MKWWKKALIATGVLLVIDAGFAFAMHQHIHNTSANAQIEGLRDDKLGGLCGQILGAGTPLLWIAAYFRDKKQRSSSA